MDVESGEITSVIGPNGAGKTTLFNVITGFLKSDGGKVVLNGKDITNMAPHDVVRMGMSRTFQKVNIFPRMSLVDNIVMGYYDIKGDSLFSSIFLTGHMRKEYEKKREAAREMLSYVGLSKYENNIANDLSYGQQKLVEIGRALASEPQVLLLDEPMAGLNLVMIEKMLSLIHDIRDQGKAVVLIEHNMDVIKEISDKVFVLNFGKLIAEGTAEEVMSSEEVISSYLGVSTSAEAE